MVGKLSLGWIAPQELGQPRTLPILGIKEAWVVLRLSIDVNNSRYKLLQTQDTKEDEGIDRHFRGPRANRQSLTTTLRGHL